MILLIALLKLIKVKWYWFQKPPESDHSKIAWEELAVRNNTCNFFAGIMQDECKIFLGVGQEGWSDRVGTNKKEWTFHVASL